MGVESRQRVRLLIHAYREGQNRIHHGRQTIRVHGEKKKKNTCGRLTIAVQTFSYDEVGLFVLDALDGSGQVAHFSLDGGHVPFVGHVDDPMHVEAVDQAEYSTIQHSTA